MQVSGTSGVYGDSNLQSLLALLQSQAASSAGQYSPSGSSSITTSSSSSTAGSASTPTSGAASSQFATETLSALLQAQSGQTNPATAIADQVINTLNPGGTSLSLSQVETALTGSSASSPANTALASAFSQLDTNGDGQLSASELAAGVEALQQADGGGHHHHHHHHAEASSSTDATASTTATTSAASGASVATTSTTGSSTASAASSAEAAEATS